MSDMGASAAEVTSVLRDEGRAALARRDWQGAWDLFARAVAQEETPEALEGLSWAAWWLGDADALFDARERAYRSYRAAGRDIDAARVAAWIGTDSVDFRGEVAVAQGWLRRARSLLEGHEAVPELGWLYIHEAEKLLFAGDTERARELGARATELGRRFESLDLEMLGLATEGLALVFDGRFDEGIVRLDESATTALAEEFADLWAVVWTCCYLIYGCEQVRDYDRAAQWCRKVGAWTEKLNIKFVTGTCRAHYAGVLIWRGTWDEAELELTESADTLAELRPPLAMEALARLGELRRKQGRLDEAMEIFDRSQGHSIALLGAGEVCLMNGDPPGAMERAEEYLRQSSSEPASPRVAGLDLLTRAAAAHGDIDRASRSLAELTQLADAMPALAVQASVAYARGTVAAATGDRDRARIAFEDAIRYYQRLGAPYEEATARLALAGELGARDRTADALRHATTAARLFERIGATHGARLASSAIRSLGSDPGGITLTKREREVLRLVADGNTNRGIAERLVLSEHTVNRHVTNILSKLGAVSRSAAVAEAMRHDLL